MTYEELEFLRESNAIEGVHDALSYQQAIIAWQYLLTQEEMTTGVILKTHKILMLHQKLRPSEKGYFREIPVWVGGREGMEHDKIRPAATHWCVNVTDLIENGQKESKIFKERMVKEHHVIYEKIHPFVDGNGRTGRMFLNWERLKLGLPIHVIHTGKEQQEYYDWFKN